MSKTKGKATAKNGESIYQVRLPTDFYIELKKLAAERQVHLSDLCKEGFTMVLKKYKKK